MSRSRKKNPFLSFAIIPRGLVAHWKNQCNRSLRRIDDDQEIPNGKHYRKITDPWTRPDDGKQYWDDPKARRK